MITQDIFVGIVAIAVGIFVMASAVIQWQWINRFWMTRRIENAANGSISRLVIIGLGALCTILGTLLLLGFFPSESESEPEPKEKLGLLWHSSTR